MNWTMPADLRAQVQKLWDKGLILASLVDDQKLFPRRLTLKKPTSSELADRFPEVRNWIGDLLRGKYYRVAMRDLRHHVIGKNTIPDEIWVDSLEDALNLIGKGRDAGRFNEILDLTRERMPALLPWLAGRPMKALELADNWPLLMEVILWMQSHPRPCIYPRQMDIPGIHTKFIESHRAVLKELLDLALPTDAIKVETTGITGMSEFCRRYGFLDKPLRVRFRILDPELALLSAGTDQDIAVNQETFNGLNLKVSRVFITENETNFLAFPSLPGSMVIFGAGYGFEMLAQADWLHLCSIYYWGDIDTHGFAILDQLREHFPHVKSILMDRETLMAHEQQWVTEPNPCVATLARVNVEERSLFDDLRNNRIGPAVRLEQERIGFKWVNRVLKSIPY